MHDITKLLLAKIFRIKIELEVHVYYSERSGVWKS